MMSGQTHCAANGAEYAQWLSSRLVPAITPLAISCPVTNAIFVTEVNMPLSAIGQTSEAYAGATTTYVPSICDQSVF